MKTLTEGTTFPIEETTLRFRNWGPRKEIDEFLRAFVDAAWERGIKPTKLEDHVNELKATQRHLEDMRALTFKSGKPGTEGQPK